MARSARVAEVRAEHLLTELLVAQGWDCRRPPGGELLRQQEYKDHPHLKEIFKGRSKGGGDGYGLPEAVLVDRETLQPIAVIEAKATVADLPKAIGEATRAYGKACVDAGFRPLAIALAGASEDDFVVRVFKWDGMAWRPVTYEGNAIGWIPIRIDAERLRAVSASAELRPTVPPPEVLASRADEINRLLRESKVRDGLRPGIVAATMLALWQSKGDIRKDPSSILADINRACAEAFWKAGKADLSRSLVIDEANAELAVKMRRIVTILERLNITVLTAEHDYLGQLYETFFRYTGGNTIGQYFTPRHVASFMADMCQIGPDDVVLDPACGTGGFLIAAMNRMQVTGKLSRAQVVARVGRQLVGFDSEPQTAALCVANMILRGDGTTGVRRGDCFGAGYPKGEADAVMMNPPFPHRKTDTSTDRFVDRALEGLKRGGRAAILVPLSLLVKRNMQAWRSRLLEKNTLEAVVALPDELFQPYASATTAIIVVTKGVAHPRGKAVFFARVENDGFELRKGSRVPRDGSELETVMAAYLQHATHLGLCGTSIVPGGEWAPGAFVPAAPLETADALRRVEEIVRLKAASIVKLAPQFFRFSEALARRELVPQDYRRLMQRKLNAADRPRGRTLGGQFDIIYGQPQLESKSHLLPGDTPVISSSGADNGVYGFFSFEEVLEAPFVTVPRTGSIGDAHVQEWSCSVTSDCLILLPRKGVPLEVLYVAAAVLRREAWRFNYGRKITPARVSSFPLPMEDGLLASVGLRIAEGKEIERVAMQKMKLDASDLWAEWEEVADDEDAA